MSAIFRKPIHEMSEEEMIVAVQTLQSEREALRAEAIARKRKETETGVRAAPVPRQPRVTRPKQEDSAKADALKALFGDD